MKKHFFSCLLLVISSFLFSCKSSNLLHANFESDALGNPPATAISGDPSGDLIQFNPALTPQLKVQNSATAGEKALHFINNSVGDISGHSRWVGFRGISTDLINPLWFTHTAKNTGAVNDVLMDVSDGHGHLMARMRIKADGEVALAKNILDLYTDVIGTLGPDGHTIIFTATPSQLKYNVTIFQKTGGSITATDKPMITDNVLSFANPAHPTLSFSHSETPSAGHKYIIEVVTISKKKPD